jgi:hypothetical protein
MEPSGRKGRSFGSSGRSREPRVQHVHRRPLPSLPAEYTLRDRLADSGAADSRCSGRSSVLPQELRSLGGVDDQLSFDLH